MIYRVETCDKNYNGKIYRTHNAADVVKFIKKSVKEGMCFELCMITEHCINYRLIDTSLTGLVYTNSCVKVPKAIEKLMREVSRND